MKKEGKLVITRHQGQSFQIGDDVTVSIGKVNHRGQVKIMITAPIEVSIVRTELLNQQKGKK